MKAYSPLMATGSGIAVAHSHPMRKPIVPFLTVLLAGLLTACGGSEVDNHNASEDAAALSLFPPRPTVAITGMAPAIAPVGPATQGSGCVGAACIAGGISVPVGPATQGCEGDPSLPGPISLSPGTTVTGEDIRQFNCKWMTEVWRQKFLGEIDASAGYTWGAYSNRSVAWEIGAYMEAMVRMYDLTRAPQYVDRLHELVMEALATRDDHRPDHLSNLRTDQLRGGKVMPAWGNVGVDVGWYYTSSITVAAVLSYPIAAFARIVAENPVLWAKYGADAQTAADQVLETVEAFLPELHSQKGRDGLIETYFGTPSTYRLLTPDRCQIAYEEALARVDQLDPKRTNPDANDVRSRLEQLKNLCNEARQVAGQSIGHNENQVVIAVLIELSRALDSDLYPLNLLPPVASPLAIAPPPTVSRERLTAERKRYVKGMATVIMPAIVASTHRYFVNRLELNWENGAHFYKWHMGGNDLDSTSKNHSDAEHESRTMRFFGLLWDNRRRLDALLAAYGLDSIRQLDNSGNLLSEGFANTFLLMIARSVTPGKGGHLSQSVYGEPPDPSHTYYDGTCDGWLVLAEFNSAVYSKCEAVSLRPWDPPFDNPTKDPNNQPVPQPALNKWANPAAVHAALLALKRFRSPSAALISFSVTKADVVPSAAAFDVQGTYTLGAGPTNPVTDAVIVKLYRTGSAPAWATIVIPEGSFRWASGGFVYKGLLDGVSVEATIVPTGGSYGGKYQFHLSGAGVPGLPTTNPVTVTFIIGNNGGTATVNATIR